MKEREPESFNDSDTLRDVSLDGYRLTTWATTRMDHRGQTVIGYRLRDLEGEVIFEGEDFCASPMHADDSDESLRALIGFLTLRPGDTDREYFEGYTEKQMGFARGAAEGLAFYAMEDEDGEDGEDGWKAPVFVDWKDRPQSA